MAVLNLHNSRDYITDRACLTQAIVTTLGVYKLSLQEEFGALE